MKIYQTKKRVEIEISDEQSITDVVISCKVLSASIVTYLTKVLKMDKMKVVEILGADFEKVSSLLEDFENQKNFLNKTKRKNGD